MRWAARLVCMILAFAPYASFAAPVAEAASPDGLGGNGPCRSEHHSFANPVFGAPATHVFLPAGEAEAPTGGTCGDNSRPTVLFAHGYSASLPDLYGALVGHLVSLGHVVVYPGYQIQYDPARQYRQVEGGMSEAVRRFGQIDADRLGIVGHSFGAGMAPSLTLWAADRGWGSSSLWMVPMMPHFSLQTGSGPIDVPDHTRAVVIAGQTDTFVDHRIGIEIFHALDIPSDHKEHVTYLNDTTFVPKLGGDHLAPLTIPLVLPANELDTQGIWRAIDSVAFCSLPDTSLTLDETDAACHADLADVGTRNGRPIRRAEATDDPRDLNRGSLQECEFFLNPRPCP